MRNAIHILLFISALICCASCGNNYQGVEKLGTVEYYPKFLWNSEGITYVERILTMNWSPDAKADANCYAEYAFVDLNQNVIPTSILEVIIDGNISANNRFKVGSNQDQVNFKFRFKPGSKEGKHQGYLMLVNHNLDRQSGIDIKDQNNVSALQWQLEYEEGWNPLATVLFWICVAILFGLVLWLTILQRYFYPRFRAINKTMIIPNQAPISIHFRGARMVVIDKDRHKQSWWNKLWTGKIIYKQHPAITSPIILKPTSKGSKISFKAANPSNYTCAPNPIALQPSRVTDILNKQQITIQ